MTAPLASAAGAAAVAAAVAASVAVAAVEGPAVTGRPGTIPAMLPPASC